MAMLTDNFDSYSTGDLNGQGSWSGAVAWDVATTVAQSAPNAAKATQTDESGQTIVKSISGNTSGTQRFYFYITSSGQLNTDEVQVRLREGGVFKCGLKIRYLTASSDCDAQSVGSATQTEFTGITADAWHFGDIVFDCGTDEFTVSIDGGAASASRAFNTAATEINEVALFSAVAAPAYIDTLSDPNAPVVSTTPPRRRMMLGIGS